MHRKDLTTDISPESTKEETSTKALHQSLKFSDSGGLSGRGDLMTFIVCDGTTCCRTPAEKKPEKKIASGDAKNDPPSKLISMPPPAKKVTAPTFRKTEKSTDFGTPFEQSSSRRFQVPAQEHVSQMLPLLMKSDPQEETKEDVKPEPTTVHREKKAASKVSTTLPLALQRIHEKLSHETASETLPYVN